MKTVYFVRHGQSEANVAPVFQEPDSPLSAEGRMQAEKIAERASKLAFDGFISSPFARAKATAEAITAKTGIQPEYNDLFVERLKPTSINGRPYSDSIAGKIWEKWNESLFNPELKVEDGENYADLVRRADDALEYLARRKEENMLVVTHGYILRTMVARVLLGVTLTPESFRSFQDAIHTENTALTVLRYHETFRKAAHWNLWIFNDHAHLG
jgi:broad specificity phosphatase PhoE